MSAGSAVGRDEQIFILPVSLLQTHHALKREFLEISRAVRVAPGWHYLLDLVWAAEQLRRSSIPVGTVLDAGAGIGLMQWWMARQGIDVISVDREPRHFSRRMRALARVEGAHEALPTLRRSAFVRLANREGASRVRWILQVPDLVLDLASGDPPRPSAGHVRIAQADLRNLSFVPSDSIDAIVSISSLEHNAIEDLPRVVSELLRVLKPGGRLIATVGAASTEDWFHQPSSGWCFTEATLRSVFSLPAGCASNFADYDRLMAELTACDELRTNLAPFYRRSGKNGMPWGRWNPQYQSVGLVKVKSERTLDLPIRPPRCTR